MDFALTLSKKFAGIEVQFRGEEVRYFLVVIDRRGKKLSVTETLETNDPAELKSKLDAATEIAVCFTGKGILYRSLDVDPEAEVLHKILPNASANDFYLQTVPRSASGVFVSVIRRAQADEVLDKFPEGVTHFSVGPSPVQVLLPLFENPFRELRFGRHFIAFENGSSGEIRFEENDAGGSINIGDETIEKNLLSAFASAFSLATGDFPQVKCERMEEASEKFKQHRQFTRTWKLTVAASFGLLLLNYFFFSYFWSAKNALEEKIGLNGQDLVQVRELETRVHDREEFLAHSGLAGNARQSWYADQLAAELPPQIRLSRLSVSPRLEIQKEDTIAFQPALVEIEGSCSQSLVLNNWIQLLKQKSWIGAATLKTYVQDKTMQQGRFELTLNL